MHFFRQQEILLNENSSPSIISTKQGEMGEIGEKEKNYAQPNSPLNMSITMQLKITSNKYIGK